MPFRSPLPALLALSLLVGSSPANAQDGKPAAGALMFDATSLDAAIKGLQVFRTKMNASSPPAELTAAEQKITALHAENQTKVDDYTNTRDAVNKCLRAYAASKTADRTSQVQRKVSAISADQPALEKFSAEYARIATALNSATARKDSAEMQRLNAELTTVLTVDARGDSIAGTKKCGAIPPKPPAATQIEEQQAIVDGLRNPLVAAADSAGARAASVQPTRFTQMRERVQQFLASDSAFTGAEGELLKARKADLQALFAPPGKS